MENKEEKRPPTANEIRLNEAAAILGVKTEFDFYDDFDQVSVEFPDDASFYAFAERCGGPEMSAFVKRHRQGVAFMALRAVYDETGDRLKAKDIEENYALGRISLKDGQAKLGELKGGLSPDQLALLRVHLEKAAKYLRPCLKIEHMDGKLRAYLISLAMEEPLASMPFDADISDRNSLERAIGQAMLDIAPKYFG